MLLQQMAFHELCNDWSHLFQRYEDLLLLRTAGITVRTLELQGE
jgi:hypothetical protein